MTLLRPVVDVREIPPACRELRRELPSLRDYASDSPGLEEQSLLAYLGQGVVCGIYSDPGLLFDVLHPGRRIEPLLLQQGEQQRTIHPNVILTDGDWLWPGALLYYLEQYHLRLPEDFLRHARQRTWRIDPGAISLADADWEAFDKPPGLVSA